MSGARRPADPVLERPYFKNANYSETAVIKQMFISGTEGDTDAGYPSLGDLL